MSQEEWTSTEQEILSKMVDIGRYVNDDAKHIDARVYESAFMAINVFRWQTDGGDDFCWNVYLTLLRGHKHFAKISEILSPEHDPNGEYDSISKSQFLFPSSSVTFFEHVDEGIKIGSDYRHIHNKPEERSPVPTALIAIDVINTYQAASGYQNTLDMTNRDYPRRVLNKHYIAS